MLELLITMHSIHVQNDRRDLSRLWRTRYHLPPMLSMKVTLAIASLPFAAALIGFACGPVNDPNDVGGFEYAALEAMPVTTPEVSAAKRANHAIKTAFIVVMENENWHEIKGDKDAAYINDVLLKEGASADNYYDNPREVHPSEPNYIWMEAGDNLGIHDDHIPADNYRTTKKHLTSLLAAAQVPWKTYQQGIDGKTCPLVEVGDYAPKHNAPIYFTDITDNNNPHSANCIAHVRPLEELDRDLAANTVSGYVFITPDRCHNMHDACESGNQVKNGDDFLREQIPKLQASEAYRNGGAIFVTWDESEGGTYPIGMIVLSPLARPGFVSHVRYNHSSLLRTMQEIFAVEPYLRDAQKATPLSDMFTAYP